VSGVATTDGRTVEMIAVTAGRTVGIGAERFGVTGAVGRSWIVLLAA